MKTSRIWKAAAAAVLALATLFAVPATAQAVDYPPSGTATISGVIQPGSTAVFSFVPGTFTPGESVRFIIRGQGAYATLATLFTVNTTPPVTKTAAADGSASVSVTFPEDARCVYTLTATDLTTNKSYESSYDLGNCAGGAGTGLATTGASGDQLLWAWVAGGALAFVGGGALVFASVRKQRKLAE